MTAPLPTTGSRMNRKRVIVLMTMGVFVVLGTLMLLIFDGPPPWPILVAFTISHVFFCWVVARTKPFSGPYRKPLTDPDPSEWPRIR